MNYPNAQKGMKKIILGQFFAIIATVLTSGTALLLSVYLFTDSENKASAIRWAFSGMAFGLASVIMLSLTAVISFLGYFQTSKDEPEFKKAMFCTLAVGAMSVIGTFFKFPNGFISTVLNSSGSIVEMFVIIFSVSGAIKILEKSEHPDIAQKGDAVLKIIVVTYIITSVDSLVIRIFELSTHAKIVSIVVGAIDLIVNIFQYVVYIRFLRQSLKTINND
ncbi:MAG: hypothetical protein IIU14_02215 [Ruminococcus sp.]|nr:hypothetical protein [Ruminococcus sp.]